MTIVGCSPLAVGRVQMFTPVPPAKTGVAHYASMIIPALRARVELEVISSPHGQRPTANGQRIYQLGNNPHHEWVYLEAMRVPGIIVLHEIVMHHLIVEMTLARGDVEGYVAAMEANHGAVGAAWARGRAAGLHSEMGNFLLPASIDVAQRSSGVIVHNRYAADRLRSLGVTTPIHLVGHPFEAHPEANARRDECRARLGYAPDERVIGFFGFVTMAKRPEVVVEAFTRARRLHPKLRLLVVGEPAPNVDLGLFRGQGITFTGYTPDEEFPPYVAAVDRLVNLRYPSAGEASGILMRALDAGKPVAMSDYGPFAEMPDDCVVKIPFDREVDALVEFFAGDVADMSAAQRRWIEQNATVAAAADGYVRALQCRTGSQPVRSPTRPPSESNGRVENGRVENGRVENPSYIARSVPLFPAIHASLAKGSLTLRNDGDFTIKARTYGEPGYRVIAKWDGGDRWLQLPCDLAPGESVSIDAPSAGRLRLYHAIESIPTLDAEPFAELVDAAV